MKLVILSQVLNDVIIINMSLERTVKWIDKTEGRDKFCKAVQYACRFLKHRFQLNGRKDAAKKFDALFTNMRDARKLFRLFKSINEAKKIKELLALPRDVDNVLNIAIRAFFLLYWLFDNLNILSKIKIIEQDAKKFAKWGATFWLLALATNLVLLIKSLAANFSKSKELSMNYYSSPSQSQTKEKQKEYQALSIKRSAIYLNIVKVVGDMLPAGQASEFWQTVIGVSANDSVCGVGGLTAAILTSYQLYE